MKNLTLKGKGGSLSIVKHPAFLDEAIHRTLKHIGV